MARTAGKTERTSAMGRKEQRRNLHQSFSRAQLLDAAEEVFGRKGFHQTTLKEIAELAEFSVGSVYSFFESKEDLFQQIYVRRGEDFMPAVRRVLTAADRSALDQLHDLVDFQVGWFREHRAFARLYLRSSTPLVPPENEFESATAQNYVETMGLQADLFQRGQADGSIRRGDPTVLSRIFSGIIGSFQASDPYVFDDAPTTESYSLEELHDLIHHAFAERSSSLSAPARRAPRGGRSADPGTTTR